MSRYFNADVEIPCGNCGHKTPQSVNQLEQSPTITCPKCGTVIKIDASEFQTKMKAVDKAMDDLVRQFKKLGK